MGSVIAVTRNDCGDRRPGRLAAFSRPLSNSPIALLATDSIAGSLLCLPHRRAEQQPILGICSDACRPQLGQYIPLQFQSHRDSSLLAPFS
jgi:hypothetical protein